MRPILEEILYNLCDNAIKYNKEGTALSITIQFENNKLSLIICDNGVGIPESSLSTIFDPFVRVDKSRNIHSGGTGLGLSITKTIIFRFPINWQFQFKIQIRQEICWLILMIII